MTGDEKFFHLCLAEAQNLDRRLGLCCCAAATVIAERVFTHIPHGMQLDQAVYELLGYIYLDPATARPEWIPEDTERLTFKDLNRDPT
jgi:hypothetical protein